MPMELTKFKIKQNIKRCLAKGMRRFSHKCRLEILNYHSVHPSNPYSTHPDDFEKQMKFLVSNYEVISLDELYERKVKDVALNGISVSVTFDDGYEDNYIYALPILQKFNIGATVFITTGYINGEIDIAKQFKGYKYLKPLDWGQVKEMQKVGISFGSHTHTHPTLPLISEYRLLEELMVSKQLIEKKLREEIVSLAYPFGRKKHFNERVEMIARKVGYKYACSTIWGCDNSETNMFALHRIRIDAHDTFDDFREKINGYWNFISWRK